MDQRTRTGIPRLSECELRSLCVDQYAVDGALQLLPSDRDQNVLVVRADGAAFVLKVAHASVARGVLEAENAAFTWVHDHVAPSPTLHGLAVPRLVPTRTGSAITVVRSGDHDHLVRLITVVDGTPIGAMPMHTDALRHDVGRTVGVLSAALTHFDHPASHRDLDWDLARAERVVAEHRHRVVDEAVGDAIDRFVAHYAGTIAPHLGTLRRTVVHGDPNDYNVLGDAASQRVTGIVDFGDMVYSHTVNDAAIAMAYVCLSADRPLAAAAQVARGFHAQQPLSELEISLLFGLMGMRLCVSACLAAKQQAERPFDRYLGVSQEPIRRVLPMLAAIHPRLAHYTFRDACGLTPVPESACVSEWIAAHASTFAPLLGTPLVAPTATALDLGVGSHVVSSDPELNAAAPLDARLAQLLRERGSMVGVGGYNEARLIYRWPVLSASEEPRTIHLGIDVTAPAGTPIHAPLDGEVYGFENANGFLDYGPVIVLRHVTTGAEEVPFYTLYGHLSLDSLDGLAVGQRIARGQEFARIGSAPVNGDWWEHVHAQLIVDMLDVPCNVHGAARATERSVWLSLCPDPNTLFGVSPALCVAARTTAELEVSRHAMFPSNVRLAHREAPLAMVRGAGQYLYDVHGHRFIDAYNNVPHVGHCHPQVVRAVSEQLALLNTNTRYLQHQLTDYAADLLATFPASLDVCCFTASGSEANELALRLARAATGGHDVIVMDSAYHGHTTTCIDLSPYKHNGPGGTGAPEWVHVSPVPDVYRTPAVPAQAGPWFAAQVGDVLDRMANDGRTLAAYLAETCPSVAGQIMLPQGFLADVYARVRRAGGVCIADEVQTGLGRIGTHWWAFEQHGVVPDIVVLGKPIANGYPMGAVVTTRAIAERFDNGMEFFSTFGGSTAACVAAHATLRVTQEEELMSHAQRVGDHLLAGFQSLQQSHELVGDVRGSGLFLGIELVRDRESKAPAAEAADHVVQHLRMQRVLAGTDGPHHNVLKFRGPMCLSVADADLVLERLDAALHYAQMRRPSTPSTSRSGGAS